MTQQQQNKAAEGVSTALAILDTLISQPERAWGVRELAERLSMSRTTTNRVLSQMCSEGLASKTIESSYSVGPRLCVLSKALFHTHPVLNSGKNVLDNIRRQTGGTVFMCVQNVDGQSCFVTLESESETPLRYRNAPGNVLPTYAGAAGLAILSQLEEKAWPDKVRVFTEKTITSRKDRSNVLHHVKEQGFAVSIGQHIVGAAGIAVPFRFSPALIGSVSVSRPEWEFEEERIPSIVEVLHRCLGELEQDATNNYEKAVREKYVLRPEATRASTQVERVNQLLTFLASHPGHPLTLKEIGGIVGAGNFAVASLVEAAEQHGVLCRDQQRSLHIGPTLLRWLVTTDSSQTLDYLALAEMHQLSSLTGETTGLALLYGDSRRLVMIQSVPGNAQIRYVLDTPVDIPLHLGATGKVVLAYRPEWIEEIDLHPDVQGRTINISELRKTLEEARANGFVVAEGERIAQAFGVAAPIFIDGKIAGSLTVTIPRYRVDRSKIATLSDQVKAAASSLSRLFSIM